MTDRASELWREAVDRHTKALTPAEPSWCEMQERAQEILSGAALAPRVAPLTTTISQEEIDERTAKTQRWADMWLDQAPIDFARCKHVSSGESDCGDPVCRMVRAEALSWMVNESINLSERVDAVIEEAEALLDG